MLAAHSRPRKPRAAPEPAWKYATLHAATVHEGDTEAESGTRGLIDELFAQLLRLHRDERLADARVARNDALVALRTAAEAEEVAATETVLPIRAGTAAERENGETASHLRAEGSRATRRLKSARAAHIEAQARADALALRLREATDALTEQMMTVAADAMPRLQLHVALVNVHRGYVGHSALAPLADDLPRRLVLRASTPPEVQP